MGAYPVLKRFTADEYLQIERPALYRSEFIDGLIYERPGAAARHCAI